jgi:hypothetical protein
MGACLILEGELAKSNARLMRLWRERVIVSGRVTLVSFARAGS